MDSDVLLTIGGVDTHADFHVSVVLDQVGRRLGEVTISNDEDGYRRLLRWARGFGELACVGVEGTGSYGSGLSRFLRSNDVRVTEVNRLSRQSTAGGTVSTMQQTLRPLQERSFPGRQPANRKPPTDVWRCSGPSRWLAARQ